MDDKSDNNFSGQPGEPVTDYSTIEEQISAFVDGELPMEEMDLLLRRLERDEDYRAIFSRYCLVGDLLRGDAGQSDRIRTGVMQQVTEMESEAPVATPAATSSSPRRRVVGLAVAAGVCAVAVLNMFPESGNFVSGSATQATAAVAPQDAAKPFNQQNEQLVAASREVSTSAQQSRRVAAYSDPQADGYAGRAQSPHTERMASYLASHSAHGRTISWRVAESGFTVQQARYVP